MDIAITINKQDKTPVYRQIIIRLTALVRDGVLSPGEALPSERELADQLGVARGTVTRAYEELVRNNIIEILPNKGSVVSARQNIVPGNRKDKAVALIQELLDQMRDLRFTHRETRALIDLAILERKSSWAQIAVAAVDCNPESLAIYHRQLGFMARVNIKKLLLEDVLHDPRAEQRLTAFDLVLTTTTHADELLAHVPGLHDRMIRVSVSPSQQSIIDLAALRPSQKIGVLCESRQFCRIVDRKLRDFMVPRHNVQTLLTGDNNDWRAFLANKQILIVPPGFTPGPDREHIDAMQAFTERGGKLVYFDYQIERGSILHIEERLKDLLSQRESESEI